jgi:hypothetical protein
MMQQGPLGWARWPRTAWKAENDERKRSWRHEQPKEWPEKEKGKLLDGHQCRGEFQRAKEKGFAVKRRLGERLRRSKAFRLPEEPKGRNYAQLLTE